MISMFDSAEGWGTGRPVGVGAVPAVGERANLSFEALPPGRYAVRAFHDLNGDGKMNSNAFGVPIEPVASSNGAEPRFGPPQWAEAAFNAGPGETRHPITFR